MCRILYPGVTETEYAEEAAGGPAFEGEKLIAVVLNYLIPWFRSQVQELESALAQEKLRTLEVSIIAASSNA